MMMTMILCKEYSRLDAFQMCSGFLVWYTELEHSRSSQVLS